MENINGHLDLDAEINLKRTWCESVDWRHVTQDGNQSRAVVNVVMNFRKRWGIY
jgi:hypothetical protein